MRKLIKKATVVIVFAGLCVSILPLSAAARWIALPDGTFVNIGSPWRQGGNPTITHFDPATGIANQSRDVGLRRMGVGPLDLWNSTGGRTRYYNRR